MVAAFRKSRTDYVQRYMFMTSRHIHQVGLLTLTPTHETLDLRRLMLARHLRRRPNLNSTLAQRLVFCCVALNINI